MCFFFNLREKEHEAELIRRWGESGKHGEKKNNMVKLLSMKKILLIKDINQKGKKNY